MGLDTKALFTVAFQGSLSEKQTQSMSRMMASPYLPQGVLAAPVSSRTPSRVFSMAMYVGNASSVIMSPTSTTQ